MAAADRIGTWRRKGAWPIALLGGLLLVLAFATPPPAAAAGYWVPSPTETFQWNLAEPIEPTADAEIYDIDAFENEASVVAALHAQGRHVVCYMDAGSWEEWRPDAGEFPASVLGKKYAGFSDEKWLDIRQLSILEPIMTKRLEMCKAKGFEGVEADNVEGWENTTGFPLTAAEQLTYNEWLANEAHSLGLSIALKNDVEQTKELEPYFDWDLTEECAGRVLEKGPLNECSYLKPFTEAHKAVWSVEYNDFKLEPSQFCPEANKEGFMAVKKNVELDAWQAPCWAQGDWVGKKGAEGYDLAAFNGASDLIDMPGVAVTLVKGSRVTWASSTTDPRALESPSGSSRTAAGYSDPSEVSVQLHFEHAYKGNLHLYVVDWESKARRETITAGTQTATLAGTPTQTLAEDEKANGGFNQGSWVSFPINVAAGTTLPINVKRNAGTSAVLSAIMLGDAQPSTPEEVKQEPQGTWLTDKYGSSGYLLGGWDGVQDAYDMPGVTPTVLQGSGYVWAANTTDVRALESPDGTVRNASTLYDPNEVKLQLAFTTAYSGNLHLYALDWDNLGRQETITVNDGSGLRSVVLEKAFNNGAWISVPINVAAGGTVSITAVRKAGPNAVISGVFLGEAGAPPITTGQELSEGGWVGSFGSAGYDLAGWDGSAGDVAYIPNATVSLVQGNRWVWSQNTSDARALSDPGQLMRTAATYYAPQQIQVALNFTAAYTGDIHLYALDWDSTARREMISVNGQTAVLSSSFNKGAWVSFPISVAAGGTITITVDRTAGLNAVLSGIMLGDGGALPAPKVESAPQGAWVNAVGSAGYALASWNSSAGDVSDLPNASLSLIQGNRWQWAANTTDARALPDPSGTTHNIGTYYDPGEIQLKLSFKEAYKGDVHLYAVDWDHLTRREIITVNGQSVALGDFSEGAWVSFPINVAAGGTVSITVDRTSGPNAVLSGMFLGDSGTPPAPAVTSAPQGSWVGAYGTAGYALAGWEGATDLTSLSNASLTVEQASRYTWTGATEDVRALQSPDKSTRVASTYYDSNEIKLTLNFSSEYTGTLHLYALDWDSQGRRESISVNGQTAVLANEFVNGAWVSFPISVPAGGTVSITVTRLAGSNAVLSGVFLG